MAAVATTFFLVQHASSSSYYLLDLHPRLHPTLRQAELIQTFKNLASALRFLEKKGWVVTEVFQHRHRRPFSAETRQKLRERKLGPNNPNANGLTEEHKRRIGRANKGKYIGAENINYGKPRSVRDRIKISQGKYREAQRVKRHWVLSPAGEEFLFPLTRPIPAGWVKGRKRSPAILKRPRRRRKNSNASPTSTPLL